MIDYVRNPEGFIAAYIVWTTVDLKGQIDPKGEYVFIEDCWVHEKYRNTKILADLARMMDEQADREVKLVYWKRGKYDRLCGSFPRDKLLKLVTRKYKGEYHGI